MEFEIYGILRKKLLAKNVLPVVAGDKFHACDG